MALWHQYQVVQVIAVSIEDRAGVMLTRCEADDVTFNLNFTTLINGLLSELLNELFQLVLFGLDGFNGDYRHGLCSCGFKGLKN